jgi:hypothetical protein
MYLQAIGPQATITGHSYPPPPLSFNSSRIQPRREAPLVVEVPCIWQSDSDLNFDSAKLQLQLDIEVACEPKVHCALCIVRGVCNSARCSYSNSSLKPTAHTGTRRSLHLAMCAMCILCLTASCKLHYKLQLQAH